MRSSKIGAGVSTTTLVAWAEKKHKFFTKELVNEEKQVIMTLRKDLEKVRDLVIKYGDIGSDRIAYIDLKLYKLTKQMDKKLNSFDIRDAKRKVLPKARLMVWDGDVMTYQSFRRQMMELLDYGNPSLELETLKLQIKGPKAQEALKCLFNVRNKERAFEILDKKYGNILMVFPRIKDDLEVLKDLPTSMLEESSNIQEIINVAQTLEKYGKKEAIDSSFIQRF